MSNSKSKVSPEPRSHYGASGVGGLLVGSEPDREASFPQSGGGRTRASTEGVRGRWEAVLRLLRNLHYPRTDRPAPKKPPSRSKNRRNPGGNRLTLVLQGSERGEK